MKCPYCGEKNARITIPFEAYVDMEFDPGRKRYIAKTGQVTVYAEDWNGGMHWACCGTEEESDEVYGMAKDAQARWPDKIPVN